ncbi:hypothetical protein ACFO4L_01250 [Bacillus daqingensis]|uniref:DUF4367 domain-containing protein n=1 Tax=Bacillus daqingensis TaxID=872396 RepID=A0ABV9NPT7_9BACI
MKKTEDLLEEAEREFNWSDQEKHALWRNIDQTLHKNPTRRKGGSFTNVFSAVCFTGIIAAGAGLFMMSEGDSPAGHGNMEPAQPEPQLAVPSDDIDTGETVSMYEIPQENSDEWEINFPTVLPDNVVHEPQITLYKTDHEELAVSYAYRDRSGFFQFNQKDREHAEIDKDMRPLESVDDFELYEKMDGTILVLSDTHAYTLNLPAHDGDLKRVVESIEE